MELNLPIYDFFINCIAVEHEEPKKCRSGNPFSGSLGTDPQQGFVRKDSFGYRILLKKTIEGDKLFIAESWICPPLRNGSKPDNESYEQKVFDGVEDSLPLIEQWLLTRYEELLGGK